eukprot:c9570_g1_i1.p1 GENE.c9570_g1_i1~~c9570_g1_i1.p1  ORF type:complete len:852 (+),score=231.03 c9570_g1_i1:39-2594(+)
MLPLATVVVCLSFVPDYIKPFRANHTILQPHKDVSEIECSDFDHDWVTTTPKNLRALVSCQLAVPQLAKMGMSCATLIPTSSSRNRKVRDVCPKSCGMCGPVLARPWMDTTMAPSDRAAKLIASMNLDEKIVMVHGNVFTEYTGFVPANQRLGIPAIQMNDGPQGFRHNSMPGSTTSMPSGLTIAATWDVNAAYKWGDVMGTEFFGKGANVQLGPGLNVARVPRNGRNFEYMSGEDPFLGYTLVQPTIRAIQSHGVIANAKHYVNNNQETNRDSMSANVDERSRFEIYYPPFQGAIEAGVGSFMCSYNKINQVYACENNQTLNIDLKQRMGFQGWVMSDWGATHSISVPQGLDQEMPDDSHLGSPLKQAVLDGDIAETVVDTAVSRILTPMFQVGIFDYPNSNPITSNVTNAAHRTACRELASHAMVMLKNRNNILPLSKSGIRNIALVGLGALSPIVHGGGSGAVVPVAVQTPLNSIRKAFGLPIVQSNCSNGNFEVGIDYYQPGNEGQSSASVQDCCSLCAGRQDCLYFTFDGATCWFKSTNAGRVSSSGKTSGRCYGDLSACAGGVCVNYAESDKNGGTDIAKNSDVTIVFVQTTASEGSDRDSLSLPDGQDTMVANIAAVQPNTIVVVVTPGALLLPWSDSVASILVAFMPGQEFGDALTDVLLGVVNPSGKLPLTFPNFENEINFTVSQYPGDDNGHNATYSEHLLVGYRWYGANNVTPRFPFGHGLSYTQFQYSNLRVVPVSPNAQNGVQVSFDLQNTGSVAGSEVSQLYLAFPASAGEPPLQLKGFQKSFLQPNESVRVIFTVPPRHLSVWDVKSHNWALISGRFIAHVGASSQDIRLATPFVV